MEAQNIWDGMRSLWQTMQYERMDWRKNGERGSYGWETAIENGKNARPFLTMWEKVLSDRKPPHHGTQALRRATVSLRRK